MYQVHRLEQERNLLQRSVTEIKDEMEQFQKDTLSKNLELDISHFEEVKSIFMMSDPFSFLFVFYASSNIFANLHTGGE